MGLKLITETSFDCELTETKTHGASIVGIYSSAGLKNNNGRIYDREVLAREITKINEKAKDKTLWGELGHPPCVLGNTEILTSNGWQKIKNILENEKVATLNTSTQEIEYHEISKKIVADYIGDMYNFKNRQIDMWFTPTHNHLLINRYGKFLFANSKEINECETKKYHKCYIPKTGQWFPDDINDEFILLEGCDHIPHSKYDYSANIKINTKVFMGFLGIFLSEGYITKNKKNRITIYQNEGPIADLIRELLSKFPKEMVWKENNKNGKITFGLSDERFSNILKPLGNCYTKYIPSIFKQLDASNLYELLYWFGLGDGRGFLNESNYIKRDVFSVSEKLIDDLHEIAFKCGLSCRKSSTKCKVEYTFAGRTIKPENRQTLYFLRICTTKGIYLDKRFMKIEKTGYNGKVYCVQVKNNNFYVRNKNSVSFWTGNSPEINPERIAILTTMLEWKGDHVYGKSKVLDTPTGQIAKTLIKEGKLGISSRGLGTVSEQGHVNEDFNLITWDLVTDPSNHPSWVNGIFEGKTWASSDDVLVGIVNTNDRLNGLPKEQEIELILDRLQPILKCPKEKIYRMLEGSYSGIDVSKAFGVFRSGGSVAGSKSSYRLGNKMGSLVYTFDTMEKAKDQAKKSTKLLSPGEKKYYGMKYFEGKVSDAKKL